SKTSNTNDALPLDLHRLTLPNILAHPFVQFGRGEFYFAQPWQIADSAPIILKNTRGCASSPAWPCRGLPRDQRPRTSRRADVDEVRLHVALESGARDARIARPQPRSRARLRAPARPLHADHQARSPADDRGVSQVDGSGRTISRLRTGRVDERVLARAGF